MRGDTMKFAEVIYGDAKNSGFRNWYNSFFKPFMVEDISANGANGYKISINLSINAEDKYKNKVFDKVGEFLKQNDVISHTGIKLDYIHYADGSLLGLIYSVEKIRPESETVIIEGEKYLTETALCMISPKVKFISLICRDNNVYKKVWEYYFSEYGINIQFINSFKHENFINANAVINCKNLSERYSQLALKENSLYASDENIRLLSDKNINIIKRAEVIKNMELSALTRN